MRVLLCAFVLCLIAAPSLAQPNPVPAGQPLTVSWDANAAADVVTAYRCYADKVKVGADIPASAPRSCTTAPLAAGPHTVEVSAVNTFGEGARASLSVTAGSPPLPPVNLKIVVQVAVQPSGEVTLLAASVAREP